jgi:cytochrome c-type biogenesis protein CcmF
MSTAVGLALLFLMAVAPMLPWRRASGEVMASRLIGPAWFAAGVTVGAVLLGERGLAPLLAYALGAFAGGSAARQIRLTTRRQGWRGLVGRSNGGMIVHIGVVIVAIAIAASGSNVQQAEFTLEEGDSANFAGHTFTYEGIRTQELANRLMVQADIRIDDGPVYRPAVNQFYNTGRQIQTPSVRSTATEDLSLSLLVIPEQAGDPVVLRVTAQPLIVWLWIGGTIMVLGAVLAAWPRRRRRVDPTPVAGELGDEDQAAPADV